jgi:hypothetical protein
LEISSTLLALEYLKLVVQIPKFQVVRFNSKNLNGLKHFPCTKIANFFFHFLYFDNWIYNCICIAQPPPPPPGVGGWGKGIAYNGSILMWWDLNYNGPSFCNTLYMGHDDMGHLSWSLHKKED